MTVTGRTGATTSLGVRTTLSLLLPHSRGLAKKRSRGERRGRMTGMTLPALPRRGIPIPTTTINEVQNCRNPLWRLGFVNGSNYLLLSKLKIWVST